LRRLPLLSAGAHGGISWAIAVCVNLASLIFSAQCRPYFRTSALRRMRLATSSRADLNDVGVNDAVPRAQPSPARTIPVLLGGVAVQNWPCAICRTLAGLLLADTIRPSGGPSGVRRILALLGLMYCC